VPQLCHSSRGKWGLVRTAARPTVGAGPRSVRPVSGCGGRATHQLAGGEGPQVQDLEHGHQVRPSLESDDRPRARSKTSTPAPRSGQDSKLATVPRRSSNPRPSPPTGARHSPRALKPMAPPCPGQARPRAPSRRRLAGGADPPPGQASSPRNAFAAVLAGRARGSCAVPRPEPKAACPRSRRPRPRGGCAGPRPLAPGWAWIKPRGSVRLSCA